MGFFSKTDALDEQLSFKSAAPIEELLDIPVDVVVEDEVVEPEGDRWDIQTYWDTNWQAKVYYYENNTQKQYNNLPSYIDSDGDFYGNGRDHVVLYVDTREQAKNVVEKWLKTTVEAVRKKAALKQAGAPETTTVYL